MVETLPQKQSINGHDMKKVNISHCTKDYEVNSSIAKIIKTYKELNSNMLQHWHFSLKQPLEIQGHHTNWWGIIHFYL